MEVTSARQRRRKIGLKTKLGFAFGSVEEAMVGAAGVATMLYYNQVLGVPAALCGTAFLIASVVDAISDPLIGALSDSVRTRWGRRHPFMFLSALPLGVSFYLLYQPPASLDQSGLFLWFTCTFVALRLFKTFYAIPHAALGAELTDDYNERTKLFGWNWIVGYVGSVVLTALVLIVIFPSSPEYENGLLNQERYQWLAVLGAIVVAGAVLISAATTVDQIPQLHRMAAMAPERAGVYLRRLLRETFGNFAALIRNPSYVAVCLCWLILAISGGVIAVVSTYTFVYAFEFSTEQITLQQLVRIPGALLAVGLAAWLTRLLDKKLTVISMIAVTTFLIGLPYCLKLLGWFPGNDTVWVLVAFFGIWMLGYTTLPIVPIVIDSQLVDIADEHELKTGRRAEGAIFSIRTFAIKMTQGLGGLIGGFGLDMIGFPENASAQTLDPAVVDGLLFMMGPLYYIVVYAGLGFAFMYRIDRKRHEEILQALEQRRARVESGSPA
ncbi:MAG: MFS transporter [Pseudomonadales bacterium]